MRFEDQLRDIVEQNRFDEGEPSPDTLDTLDSREDLIEAIRSLPLGRTDILVLAVVDNPEGGVYGKFASRMSDENAKTACLEYLRKIGVVPRGVNKMLDSLRDWLPDGHPSKDV